MSWKREGDEVGDEVTLTMSADDWDRLLLVLGVAAAAARRGFSPLSFACTIALVNRLNEGNPNFPPYAIEAGTAAEARP